MSKITALEAIEYSIAGLKELEVLRAAGYQYFTIAKGSTKIVKWYKSARWVDKAVLDSLTNIEVMPIMKVNINSPIDTILAMDLSDKPVLPNTWEKNTRPTLHGMNNATVPTRVNNAANCVIDELESMQNLVSSKVKQIGFIRSANRTQWFNACCKRYRVMIMPVIVKHLMRHNLGVNSDNVLRVLDTIKCHTFNGIISYTATKRYNVMTVAKVDYPEQVRQQLRVIVEGVVSGKDDLIW